MNSNCTYNKKRKWNGQSHRSPVVLYVSFHLSRHFPECTKISKIGNNLISDENDSIPDENNAFPERNNFIPKQNNSFPEENNPFPERNISIPEENDSISGGNDIITGKNDRITEANGVLQNFYHDIPLESNHRIPDTGKIENRKRTRKNRRRPKWQCHYVT